MFQLRKSHFERILRMSKDIETVKEKDTTKEKKFGRSKVLTVVGIILCIILVPILVVNVTMIVKSYTNPDEYPSFAGYNLMIVLSPSMEDTIIRLYPAKEGYSSGLV